MILSIGTDIVEIDRIRKALSDPFLRKVLSQEEIKMTETMSEERKVQFTAGRFAAKEAIIKCLSDYEYPEMKDLNIINDEKGKPMIRYKDYDLLVSISHEKKYATGMAILQDKGDKE